MYLACAPGQQLRRAALCSPGSMIRRHAAFSFSEFQPGFLVGVIAGPANGLSDFRVQSMHNVGGTAMQCQTMQGGSSRRDDANARRYGEKVAPDRLAPSRSHCAVSAEAWGFQTCWCQMLSACVALHTFVLFPVVVYNVLRCVPAFHPNVLAELLGDKFKLSSVVFSPTDLGIPSERRRRYTTAECVDLVSAWQPFCLQHFGRLAFRRLVVDGNIYFVSPPEALEAARMQAARQDSLADAKSWRSTLSGAELTRLGEHCAVLEADFDGRGQMCHMISLTQNVDFIASAGSLIPALLRKTSIWRVVRSSRKSVPTGTIAYNLKLDRPMMPLEHLAVQGVPVPELLPAGHPSAANSPLTAFSADDEL